MRQEKEGLEKCIGSKHLLPTLSKPILASIMQRQIRWEEAEVLTLEVINTRKHYLGSQHPYVMDEIIHLGGIYRGRGRWHVAKDLARLVAELTIRSFGNDNPKAITSIVNIGSIVAERVASTTPRN